MLFTVVCYYNTGFNGVNIPDGPATLDIQESTPPYNYVFRRKSFDSLDVLQGRFISYIDIRATYQDVVDVDYVSLGHIEPTPGFTDITYHFVTGFEMLSGDTARLFITMDYITTVGGVDKIEFLDGYTKRVKATESDLGMDYFVEPDPLTAPSDVMNVQFMSLYNYSYGGSAADAGDGDVYVESIIDICALAYYSTKGAMAAGDTGVSFKTAVVDTQGNPVFEHDIKPQAYAVDSNDAWSGAPHTIARLCIGSATSDRKIMDTGTQLFKATDPVVQYGLGVMRALGLEGAIINQVRLPEKYVEVETWSAGNSAHIPEKGYPASSQTGTPLAYTENISRAIGKVDTISQSMSSCTNPLTESTLKNRRITYGEYTPYIIMSATGDTSSAKKEELDPSYSGACAVQMVCDPDTKGCPYYKIVTRSSPGLNGSNATSLFAVALMGSIKGLPWKQVPLTWSEKSGNYLDRVNYANSRHWAHQERAAEVAGFTESRSQLNRQKELQNMQFAYQTELNAITGATADFSSGMQNSMNLATEKSGAGLAKMGASIGLDLAQQSVIIAKGLDQRGISLQGRSIELSQAAAETAQGRAEANAALNYQKSKTSDALAFNLSQSVVLPQLNFPFTSDMIRDYGGNGVILCRYQYTEADAQRIDKLLNAYGVAVTVPMEKRFLTGQGLSYNDKFSYVECVGVSVTGFANWLNDAIAMQLRNGVRVWHGVKPDPQYYN